MEFVSVKLEHQATAFCNQIPNEKKRTNSTHYITEAFLLGPGRVAHAYNPSYLGGSDGKDCSLRPAWVKS
jgi:hypothetical protein